jgi:hypothetical protein
MYIQSLASLLLSLNQEHLFMSWDDPGVNDVEKHEFFKQIKELHESYNVPGICIYTYLYIHIYLCICMCLYIYIYVYIHTFICVKNMIILTKYKNFMRSITFQVYIHIYVYIYVYIYMHVYMYIYVCICIHLYV